MGSTHRYAAAFHAQQSVEKAAKAFLVHHDIRPPRTHDIEGLAENIKSVYAKVSGHLLKLRKLTRFAVIYRYPNAERRPVSLTTIKNAVKGAQSFYNVISTSIRSTDFGDNQTYKLKKHRAKSK